MSKPTLLLACFVACTSFTLRGQHETLSGPELPKPSVFFNFGVGFDNDHYQSMSLDHVLAFAKDAEAMHRDLSGFEEEATTMTSGVALYASVGFSPMGKTVNTTQVDREIQVGVGLHSPKEAMVSYKNKELDTSIVYCNLHSEVTLETAYLFKGRWGRKFNWYVGAGMSGGLTYGNEMVLISGKYFAPGEHPSTQESSAMNAEHFKARSVYYGRVYIPYGFNFSIGRRWQLGTDMRMGVGMQVIDGERPDFIKRTGAFIFGAKYRL